jgi:polyisoprenyl-phosphate glycosyltransferase
MLLSIVIPVYNEREVLPALLATLKKTLGNDLPYEIVFVDDGSLDGTSEDLRRAASGDPRIRSFSSAAISGIKLR